MASSPSRATRRLVAIVWFFWRLGLAIDWTVYWYRRLTGRICPRCHPTSAGSLEVSSWTYRALVEDKFAFWGKRTLVQDALDRAGVPQLPPAEHVTYLCQGRHPC